MKLLRLLLPLALVASLVAVAGCGDSDNSISQEELEQATEEAAAEATADAKEDAALKQLRAQVAKLRKQQKQDEQSQSNKPAGESSAATSTSSSGTIPANADDCGSGIHAQAGTTSCSFAINVAQGFFSTTGNTFDAYSPATGKAYTMNCTPGAVIVCRGGTNAVVYIQVS